MFKIYDAHYREVTFPIDSLGYGLRGLDINIGPIIYENIYTQSSYADKLVKRYPKDRDVNINILFTSMNTVDWRLKRDRVYEFFRNLGVFYVAESHQPFKMLKVIVDEGYEFERVVTNWGSAEIPLKVVDTPFKQSLHTTLDIDQEGIQSNNKWAYGMGLSGDAEQWKYSFSGTEPVFYNAGTEEIKLIQQKESEVRIDIKSSVNWFEIYDGETTFRLNKAVKNGDVLRIRGHTITLNGSNVMGDTKFNFLSVKKGWNEWEIRNLADFEFKIDFRFLYD